MPASLASLELPFWQVLVVGGVAFLAGGLLQKRQKQQPTTPAGNACADACPDLADEQRERPQKEEIEKPVQENSTFVRLVKNEGAKMVLVVRTDLGISGGDVASQCAHATLECYRQARQNAPEQLRLWERYGQAKVSVKCRSEDEIKELEAHAHRIGLVAHAFKDDARAKSGTYTVLGVGPGPISIVDKVTGHLKLY